MDGCTKNENNTEEERIIFGYHKAMFGP